MPVNYNALLTPGANPGAAYMEGAQARQNKMTGQQRMNLLASQEQRAQQDQTQQNSLYQRQVQQQDLAKQHAQEIAAAKAILYSKDAKRTAAMLHPEYVQQMGEQWNSITDEQVRQHVQDVLSLAQSQSGVAPEAPKLQAFGADQNVYSVNPDTGMPSAAPVIQGTPKTTFERKTRQIGDMQQDYNFDPKTGNDTPVGQPYKGKPTLATMPADATSVENTAQMIANGQIPMLTSMALRSPWGQAVVSRVKEIKPDFAGSTYPTQAAALRAFTTGKEAQTTRSLNVAISHMGTLGELADALGNNDTVAINKLSNLWKTQTGGAAPNNFNAARDVVANEVVKAITANGGALADRQEAQHTINAAQSPEQLKQVMATYKDLLGGQLEGLRTQYEQGTGRTDFNRYLHPETLKQLEPPQGKPSAQGQPTATATGPNGQKLGLIDGKWQPINGR